MRYDGKVLNRITKIVEKDKLPMKVHFFGPIIVIMNIGFLAIIKFVYNTSCIQDRAASFECRVFVINALTTIQTSCLLAATNITPAAASIQSARPLRQKTQFYSYAEAVEYFFRNDCYRPNDCQNSLRSFGIQPISQPTANAVC